MRGVILLLSLSSRTVRITHKYTNNYLYFGTEWYTERPLRVGRSSGANHAHIRPVPSLLLSLCELSLIHI